MTKIEQSPADTAATPPSLVLHKTVVMVGMMGAGKTAVGRALAGMLQVPFVDSDAEIERAANLSVPEIFQRDGEAFFRARETEVIARLLEGPPCILSVGGGAFLAERNREVMAARAVSVWLNADVELLWNRVKHKDTRPLLRTADPKATLQELFAARVPLYRLADVAVPCEADLSIDAMGRRVAQALVAETNAVEPRDA